GAVRADPRRVPAGAGVDRAADGLRRRPGGAPDRERAPQVRRRAAGPRTRLALPAPGTGQPAGAVAGPARGPGDLARSRLADPERDRRPGAVAHGHRRGDPGPAVLVVARRH